MGRCVFSPLPRPGPLPTRPGAAGFFGPAGGPAKPTRSRRIGITRVRPILLFLAFYPIGVATPAAQSPVHAPCQPRRGSQIFKNGSMLSHGPLLPCKNGPLKRRVGLSLPNRANCKIPDFQLILPASANCDKSAKCGILGYLVQMGKIS